MAHYEPGLYDCIVTGNGLAESTDKKTPYIFLTIQPVKRDGDHVDGKYAREVRLWITEKAVDSTIARLRDIGWEGESFKDFAANSRLLDGANIKARCEHDQQGESVYEKWELPAPGGKGLSENKPSLARQLDALFSAALKKGRKVAGTAQGKPIAEQVAEVSGEDDIPF